MKTIKDMMDASVGVDGKQSTVSTRKKVSFVVSADACSDAITEDLEITIGTLTTEHEILSVRQAKGDQYSAALLMAKFSLISVNGKPLSKASGEGDWLWEHLTTSGRQIVAGQYALLAMPSEEAQKKAMETIKAI